MSGIGKVYGVGVGPGDRELLTLKAVRHIQQADVVAYVINHRGESMAKTIASTYFNPIAVELPIYVPMAEDRTGAQQAYRQAVQHILNHVQQNRQVVVLCLGDPFFYASFIYLFALLKNHCPIEIIPGITAIQTAAALSLTPLAMGNDSMAILAAPLAQSQLMDTLQNFEHVLILKANRSRELIITALQQSGRLQEAVYCENLCFSSQQIFKLGDPLPPSSAYFALILVSPRRP